jgi:hypothetical protein
MRWSMVRRWARISLGCRRRWTAFDPAIWMDFAIIRVFLIAAKYRAQNQY